MEICGYEFDDGDICCQVPGHGESLRHLKWEESEEFWREQRAKIGKQEREDDDS